MSPRHSAALEEPRHTVQPGSGGARAGSIPRCGVSSPFRGHLSTKSNVFCIGHTSRLSDQYQVRDHMLIHYNKILSAKAAVDCSIPKSMIKSIKYSDQQRRESMKKETTSSHSSASSRRRSRDSADSVIHWKDTYDPHTYLLRRSPYSDQGPVYSPSSFISFPRHIRSPDHTGELHGSHPEFSRLHCSLTSHCSNTTAWSSPCKFQDNKTKTYTGDVLEKHSRHFTSKERPFTPRILKTQAKSALAQSRYYTPPRRKRKGVATEAETQTDLSGFRHASQTEEMEPQPLKDQEQYYENRQLSDDDGEPAEQRFSSSRLSSSDFKSPSPTLQKIHSEEEELAYLRFVADVTNEILTLGIFSDRVLERVFQQHLEKNRPRLDEGKMCHLLDILRMDLECKEESSLQSVVSNHVDSKEGFTTSPWDMVMNRSSQEEAKQHVDSLPYTDKDAKHRHPHDALIASDTRDIELVDYASGGGDDDGYHHIDGSAQSHQGSRSDCTLAPSHNYILSTLDDRGSPAHEDVDHQVMRKASENNLLNVRGKDRTLDEELGNLPNSRHVSERTDDLETLEDLQQSFSEVIQVSRGEESF